MEIIRAGSGGLLQVGPLACWGNRGVRPAGKYIRSMSTGLDAEINFLVSPQYVD